MIIGLDVDGVLANFARGFSTIAHKLYGLPVIDEDQVTHWNWEKWYCSSEQVKGCWKVIREDGQFWYRLKPLVCTKIMGQFNFYFDRISLYFITSRCDTGNASAQDQTHAWLDDHGIVYPNVLVSSKKGKLCEALGIEHFLDDKFTNCIDIVKSSPKTQVYLLGRKHNEWIPEQFPSYFEERGGKREIIVVKSVEEYFSHVTKK